MIFGGLIPPIDGILFPDFIRQTNLDLRQNDESFNLCSGP